MEVYAFRNTNQIERLSSSGGAFSALADAVFSFGGGNSKRENIEEVNNVIVIGAAFDEEFHVLHQSANVLSDCKRFRGSKYVVSDISKIYSELEASLRDGKVVLFSGTPCQVKSVRSYIYTHKLPDERFYAVDIICHGTPNANLWGDYVQWLEKKNGSKLEEFSFRYKGAKWNEYACMARFKSGKEKVNTQDVRLFTRLFFTHLVFRECCYSCKFANMNRQGDVTIGDFWGFENVMPEIAKKNGNLKGTDGLNLVLVNSPKGQKLMGNILKKSKEKGYLVEPCQSKDYLQYQHNLNMPTVRSDKVNSFREDYKNNGFEYIIRKYAGYNAKGKLHFFISKFIRETGLIRLLKTLKPK